MRNRLLYPVAAVAMGTLWFIVLFPFVGRAEGFGVRDWPANLVAMCLASLAVAMLFRRFIVVAERASFSLLSITLPGVCAFVFGCFVVLIQWLGLAFRPGGRLSSGILLVPIYCVVFGYLGLFFFGYLGLFFITLPMGYLSQWAMRRIGSPAVGDSGDGEPDGRDSKEKDR